jgi:RimJ/RimL family protein N-acetyltransferase
LSENPNAIHLLEKNLEKINWSCLSENPNAIHLLEKNSRKIDWHYFSANPSIFIKKINYKYLYQRMNMIREELMMKCMHPKRLEKFLEMGGDIDDF